jgi:hypothetical protein
MAYISTHLQVFVNTILSTELDNYYYFVTSWYRLLYSDLKIQISAKLLYILYPVMLHYEC